MAQSSFKRVTGVLHLWLGLASGIVVIIVSLTGCIFVFEEEIRNITQKEYRFVEPQSGPAISAAEAVSILHTQFPGKQVDQLRLFSQPDRAMIAKLVDHDKISPKKSGKKKKEGEEHDEEKEYAKTVVSLNPYTGQILGPWNMESDFLHTVEKIHKTLLLGEAGKWLIKFNIVIFLTMLLSGLVLWFPLKKNQVKNAFKIKFDAKWQRINYDFHNVLGFYFLIPLFLVTLTGIWWAVKPSQKLVYAVLGEGKRAEPKKGISTIPTSTIVSNYSPAEAFASVASLHKGWNEAHINFPKNLKDPIRVNLRYPYQIVRNQNVFEFDQFSGKLLNAEYFRDYTAADKVKHANRALHTGQAFGLTGKIIMFLASLFSATLPVSGFLIWYQRKNKKNIKKQPVRPAKNPATVKSTPRRTPVMQPRVVQQV
ncbi:hypothetical protein DYBT9275_03754 [Dyadobacter sp. CECT 9275]|uniref:PepSY domain-containing protein n=1 Tax=Dyadobacter helix TaxID=2822344 RepID=A0A916JEN7_9BACT|nr:PepSY-associated TM helix domain-containing protein [Dyadobacter sp. CECT 9275]CAG5006194.1 hypothetical protein DYBT9275_03754 [Dyadobacter sp. CECT 9275]